MDDLDTVLASTAAWGADVVAAGVVGADGSVLGAVGDRRRPVPLASVTKVLSALAALVAVEEGSIDLDDPAERVPGDGAGSGTTVRHLLAHTSGLPFDGDAPLHDPGTRRTYSNTGFDRLAGHLERTTGISFSDYLAEAVLGPLDASGAALPEGGSAGRDAAAGLDDLLAVGAELLAPRLIAPATLAAATAVQFPGLAGVVPGWGHHDPCDWGLGLELRTTKAPHWTPPSGSPATFGHFGAAGTFLWVDPDAAVACAVLTTTPFGPWAVDAWPQFGDAVLAAVTASRR